MVGYGRTYHSTILYLNDQLGRTSTTTRVESRSPMIGGRMEMIKSSKVCKRWKVYKKYFWMKLILDKKSVWWRKCSPAGTPGQGGVSQGFLACTSGRTWIKKMVHDSTCHLVASYAVPSSVYGETRTDDWVNLDMERRGVALNQKSRWVRIKNVSGIHLFWPAIDPSM